MNLRKISKQTTILINGSHKGGNLRRSRRSAITLSSGSIALDSIADMIIGNNHTKKNRNSILFYNFIKGFNHIRIFLLQEFDNTLLASLKSINRFLVKPIYN